MARDKISISDEKTIPGVNIQWPWSELIINGKKSIETRNYAIPKKYQGTEVAVIETPGPLGKKEAAIDKARIIGTVVFGGCYQYLSKSHWLSEYYRHLVREDDPLYAYIVGKEKWAWEIESFTKFEDLIPAPINKGIVFTSSCRI
jgi:hypothetical protein